MKRIIVIGPPGAGKSTFSRSLASIIKIPLVHLDNIFWKADGSHIDKAEFRDIVQKVMESDAWILDGDYSSTLEMRIKKCDTVFFLSYPKEICLEGIKARVGKKREDLPWIEKELDPEFMDWAENWEKNKLHILLSVIEKYKDTKQIIIFHGRSEADNYLNNLKNR